jgi:polyhydroxyalkanoate synthesis regulator phasin
MKRLIASTAMASVLVGGAAVAVAAGIPTFAGAQSEEDGTTTTTEPETSAEEDEDGEEGATRSGWVADALEDLVADGTLTEEQAEAVEDALAEARPGRGFGGRHGILAGASDIADVLGMTVEELRDALVDGQTLAEIAEASGIDPAAVVEAIVAVGQERIDAAVEDGRLTEEEAADKAAELTERAEAIVAGELDGPLGRGFGPGHGRGHRGGLFGPGADAADGGTGDEGELQDSVYTA